MILTEEQRGALAHAINYIDETDLPVGELDGFDREVLRAMIDSSDPIPDVTELVELLAAGEHEQWAGWAQAILDSEPGLSDGRKAAWPEMIATPYENLSEELKNKDRREVYLRSQAALDYIQQQSTEIDRLRASLIDLHAEYINTLEKNPECSAWDLDEQSDADQKRLRRNAAHAISIVEPPIYLQAEQRATKIKELEDAHKRSGVKYAKIINELRSSVYANMPGLKKQWDEILNTPANDKIGPSEEQIRAKMAELPSTPGPYRPAIREEAIRQLDVKPRSWQITDERVEALKVATGEMDLSENIFYLNSLKTMLEEAGQ